MTLFDYSPKPVIRTELDHTGSIIASDNENKSPENKSPEKINRDSILEHHSHKNRSVFKSKKDF